MRIDKYLKTSRIIKRRSVAADACDAGKVTINGKTAKPSSTIALGDIIEINFNSKIIKLKVEQVTEHSTKESAENMYSLL